MSVRAYVLATTWSAILTMIFSVLFKIIDQTPTMWVFFLFLCLVALFVSADGRKRSP